MSNVAFPTLPELYQGARASIMLVKTQWGFTRSLRMRVVALVGLLVAGFSVTIMSQTGSMVKFAAIEQTGIVQTYAKTYLASFQRGELGGIGATALGICILSALVSPFTGATSTSFLPPKELAGLSVTRWHRFSDSVIAQSISSISVLQLITLTALSSMITLDGGRTQGLIFTWAVWISLVCLTIMALWISEYIHRRFGKTTRFVILGIFAAIVGTAVLIDPQHGTTVFGIGNLYADVVQNVGTSGTLYAVLAPLAVIGAGAVFMYAGAVLASITLALPEESSRQSVQDVYSGKFAIKSPTPTWMLVRSVFRLPEVRKPIISAVVIGVILTTFAPQSFAINSTFAVIIPLIIALAWGSNAFAHLGGGTTWVLSQPNALKRAPWTLFAIQLSGSLILFFLIWTPSVLIGRNSLDDLFINLLAVLASGTIVARSATTKSLRHPSATYFGARSESTLSPSKALQYTLLFSLWGGQVGVIVLAIENNLFRFGILALVILVQILRLTWLQEFWEKPENRRRVAAAVAND